MADSALASSFRQATNYTKGPRNGAVELVVVHDMEYPERLTAAEDVAKFFANQKPSKTAGSSAHYNVDADSIAQSVHEADIAWHAPGANHNGIGIEHAGYARQTAAEWADEFSEKMLRLSARLTAEICKRRGIPTVFVDAAALVKGGKGITTHWEVTKAFKRGNHTDPGANFPMVHYIDLVRDSTPAQEEDDMDVLTYDIGRKTGYLFAGGKLKVLTEAQAAALVKLGVRRQDLSSAEIDALAAL